MNVEILYFDGCPTYEATERMVREVLAEQDIEAKVRLVAVNTDEEADLLRFPGSPTIRVNGRDISPEGAKEREHWRLGCRVYATPEGLGGAPTAEMLREVLGTRGEDDAGIHR
jgi:hypothetical protein